MYDTNTEPLPSLSFWVHVLPYVLVCMCEQEQELGVRFVAAGGEGDEDEEEELDDWEDVVAELGNPLDMRPARGEAGEGGPRG